MADTKRTAPSVDAGDLAEWVEHFRKHLTEATADQLASATGRQAAGSPRHAEQAEACAEGYAHALFLLGLHLVGDSTITDAALDLARERVTDRSAA
jgi:hypothetical protein